MSVRVLATASIAVLWSLSIALPAQQPSAALPYTVVTRDARRPLATRAIGGQEMFALDDLARLFNLTVREDAAAGGLTVSAGTQTIVLSTQQPLASIAGRMISLPAAPAREGRTWYVPVDFVTRALASILPAGLELRKPSRLVLAGGVRLPRIAARTDALGAGTTRVTIDVAPPTPHSVTQEATRILIRFDADALDIAEIRVTPNDTVTGVHAGDAPTVVAIDLGPRFASFRASDQPAPTPGSARIFVDILAQTEPPPAGGPPAPPAPPTPDTPPLLDLPTPGGLRAIVIDAGHGGDDTGVKGAQGTLEKTVTLSVARRLKAALEARLGVRVLLTRDADQPVASDQRAAVANNNKADLFISLHANASLRPGVAGAEVFYLNLEGYGDKGQRALQGNPDVLPVLGGGSRDIEITPWEMAQARYIDQSAAFAQAIEAALRERVPMSPRARQQAPFRVLVGANMPAVLVELGFLTNAQQEQQLAGDAHQNVLVQALVEGIVRYRAATGGNAMMPRRNIAAVAIVLFGAVAGWVLFFGLPRWYAARQTPAAASAGAAGAASSVAVRKITASLYYLSDDGMALVPVQREVPFGATVVEQARAIVEAQLAVVPPLVSAIPPDTKLRDVFITERGDAFVDLTGDVSAKHPGGALAEIFTVYTIVNALTVNLPAVTRVQILIDGKEVDTLAGHVDLRHPLSKSMEWVLHDTH